MKHLRFMTQTGKYNREEDGKNLPRKLFGFILMGVIILCGIVAVQSCSETEQQEISSDKSEYEMLLIAEKHLLLANDQYVLNLSKEDAVQLGISADCYAKILENILQTNTWIEKVAKDTNAKVVLVDPQKHIESNKIQTGHIRLKAGNEMYRTPMTPTALGSTYSYNVDQNTYGDVKFSFSGMLLVNTASISITSGYASRTYVYFISSLSFSDDEIVGVTAKPSTWTIRAVLHSGSGSISVYY
ncbi:MAG: hypothetical protein LBD59_01565 [Prevotellaceae bacterium]|jgi:hypothetical protein|nr:hypothetical protein [Prevotellaceae bacterium]